MEKLKKRALQQPQRLLQSQCLLWTLLRTQHVAVKLAIAKTARQKIAIAPSAIAIMLSHVAAKPAIARTARKKIANAPSAIATKLSHATVKPAIAKTARKKIANAPSAFAPKIFLASA